MNAAKEHRLARQYYKRAMRRLRKRAKWLLKYKYVQEDLRGIGLFGSRRKQRREKFKALSKQLGVKIKPPSLSEINRSRTTDTFVLEAPHQPRTLQTRPTDAENPDYLLKLHLVIYGRGHKCTFRYPGFEWGRNISEAPANPTRIKGEPKFAYQPEDAIDDIVPIVEGIVNDDLVLLRMVCWHDNGHCTAPRNFDALVSAQEPIQPPSEFPTLDEALEAIVYTWSGEGDRQLIEPRYDDLRHHPLASSKHRSGR